MWAETIDVRLLPGTPELFVDYVTRFERVRDFFAHDYRSPDAYAELGRPAAARAVSRAELADVLADQVEAFGGGEAALRHADSLRGPEAVCVVTGQQPGLFGGPLYVLHKAATAVKLARRLHEDSGRPHVPVFWIANSDHSFHEAGNVHVLDRDGELVRVDWAPAAWSRTQRLSAYTLDESVDDSLARLAAAMRPSQHKAGVLELLAETFQAGETLTAAFARLLTRLFERDGLVVVDPADARLCRLGMPPLAEELAYPSPTAAAARKATEALEASGYAPQVQLRDDRLNMFSGGSERFRIRCGPAGLQGEHESKHLDPTELRARFLAEPEQFTPSVLLRPLYQDALLPTVAYVAGPGEVSYFAQLKPVYTRFGLPMPIIFPRTSLTLVNAKARRLLSARGLRVADVVVRRGSRRAASDAFAGLDDEFERLRGRLDGDTDRLAEQLRALDPVLADRAHAIRDRTVSALAVLEQRAAGCRSQRAADVERQLAWLDAYLLPEGRLQERVLGVVQGLLDAGPGLADTLVEAIDIDDHRHQAVYAHAARGEPIVAGGRRA